MLTAARNPRSFAGLQLKWTSLDFSLISPAFHCLLEASAANILTLCSSRKQCLYLHASRLALFRSHRLSNLKIPSAELLWEVLAAVKQLVFSSSDLSFWHSSHWLWMLPGKVISELQGFLKVLVNILSHLQLSFFPKCLKFLRIQCSPNFQLVWPVLVAGMIAPCVETPLFLD